MGSGDEAPEDRGSIENEVTEVNEHLSIIRTMGTSRIEYGITEIRSATGRVIVYQTFDPREVLVRIKSTGKYIQFIQRTGTIVGAVLESPGDGVLFIEQFNAVSTSRDTVFCCRLFIDIAGERFYLHCDPNGSSGAKVEFKNFPVDSISSDNLDGRCFIRKDYGNDTIFGSLFQDDLFMSYDKRKRALVMRRLPLSRIIISAFPRIPKQFLFSIEEVGTAARREVPPPRPARQTFLRRLKACFRPSERFDITN